VVSAGVLGESYWVNHNSISITVLNFDCLPTGVLPPGFVQRTRESDDFCLSPCVVLQSEPQRRRSPLFRIICEEKFFQISACIVAFARACAVFANNGAPSLQVAGAPQDVCAVWRRGGAERLRRPPAQEVSALAPREKKRRARPRGRRAVESARKPMPRPRRDAGCLQTAENIADRGKCWRSQATSQANVSCLQAANRSAPWN